MELNTNTQDHETGRVAMGAEYRGNIDPIHTGHTEYGTGIQMFETKEIKGWPRVQSTGETLTPYVQITQQVWTWNTDAWDHRNGGYSHGCHVQGEH